jgi:hypothetical protein
MYLLTKVHHKSVYLWPFIHHKSTTLYFRDATGRQGLWISLTGVLFTNAMQQSLWVCFGISVFIGL